MKTVVGLICNRPAILGYQMTRATVTIRFQRNAREVARRYGLSVVKGCLSLFGSLHIFHRFTRWTRQTLR
jgi:hypothetical protein